MIRSTITAVALLILVSGRTMAADVVLVDAGTAKTAIFAPERLLDDAAKAPEEAMTLKPEDNRRRLRESVKDLAGVLERITGAKVEVVAGKPKAGETRIPILIGEFATEKYGPPQKNFPYQQGLRIVVKPDGIGLAGESDLATSYAIYTLLDQLGCRWYMPSDMGECLPSTKTLKVAEQDLSTGPYTICRTIWYCDNAFRRRNRMGGMVLAAGHALEYTVPKELRQSHPEIRAIIDGKPHDHKVKWTHPLVADAIAEAALANLKKDPSTPTISLSPDDGLGWDESDDAKLDAGDFDPAINLISKTDRLMVLANRVAAKVTPSFPDVKFGILAYADYIRPPVREKVHPAVVPQIAPIVFSRAHPMNDPGEPNNAQARMLVEGWAKVVPATSYYFYGYNLAEVSSPNPMITKWGHDIPYIYQKGNCRYWQPETLSNFETSVHAHTLGLRLAWDPTQSPQAIVDELNAKLYGSAGKEMAAYWKAIDDGWVQVPEYAGCGFGHLRRWTPERLQNARRLIEAAKAACKTDVEKSRVELASASLSQFELFMQLRRDLFDGKFANLAKDAETYRVKSKALAKQYEPQFTFGKMGWTGESNINVIYFDAFYKATYDDAAKLAGSSQLETGPLVAWRYLTDPKKEGEAAGWSKPEFDDKGWKTTTVMQDTWSDLGLHNYMGSMWYRTTVPLKPAAGKKTRLWIGATDGRVKVFVNGKHVPYVNEKQETADSFVGFCQPASFDITAAVKDGDNQITLLCTREFLNELGTGGLLAPVVVAR